MLEIIHDLAPGAQLFFATATTSNVSFANNIAALRAAGCDILVDNVHYANESPFQDGQAPSVVSSTNGGVITQAVKDAAAAGAWVFSAAGNYGNLTSGTSGTWEGDYVDGGGSGAPILAGQLHRFGTQNWNVLSASGGSPISLYWSDPLGAASNDYDLYRLDSTGSTLLSYSLNFQNGSQGQDPYEEVTSGSAGDRAGGREMQQQRAFCTSTPKADDSRSPQRAKRTGTRPQPRRARSASRPRRRRHPVRSPRASTRLLSLKPSVRTDRAACSITATARRLRPATSPPLADVC
jgi:hypothetical protein